MAPIKWCFTAEDLENTPSGQHGMSAIEERKSLQSAAMLIQVLGERVRTSQVCINTALVYMHRFYAVLPITVFDANSTAPAVLLLAEKQNGEFTPLETLLKEANFCAGRNLKDSIDYLALHESIVLQTLGFDTAIELPSVYINEVCCQLGMSKELTKIAYHAASSSLHLTRMCLRHKPTLVACFCIYFASKLLEEKIHQTSTKRTWFEELDPSITLDQVKQVTNDYLCALKAMQCLCNGLPGYLRAYEHRISLMIQTLEKSFTPRQQPSASSSTRKDEGYKKIGTEVHNTPSPKISSDVSPPEAEITPAPASSKKEQPVLKSIFSPDWTEIEAPAGNIPDAIPINGSNSRKSPTKPIANNNEQTSQQPTTHGTKVVQPLEKAVHFSPDSCLVYDPENMALPVTPGKNLPDFNASGTTKAVSPKPIANYSPLFSDDLDCFTHPPPTPGKAMSDPCLVDDPENMPLPVTPGKNLPYFNASITKKAVSPKPVAEYYPFCFDDLDVTNPPPTPGKTIPLMDLSSKTKEQNHQSGTAKRSEEKEKPKEAEHHLEHHNKGRKRKTEQNYDNRKKHKYGSLVS